jgi:hypothetical protein
MNIAPAQLQMNVKHLQRTSQPSMYTVDGISQLSSVRQQHVSAHTGYYQGFRRSEHTGIKTKWFTVRRKRLLFFILV